MSSADALALTDQLRQHAPSQGVDLVGCTSARPFLVRWDEPVEFNPRGVLCPGHARIAGDEP